SHICGNKELLLQISQKALDLEMDGLMIETHINPEIALTDAKQQITPAELKDLISKLVIRNKSGNIEFENKLEELRAKIDEVDYELINILAKRLELVKQIGEYKRNSNITILQLKRWRNVIQDRLKKGVEKGLSKNFLIDLFELVHEESIRLQNEIMNK
ncbi:MAG: bifunctional 3-deoxy-7-phosphoheptulonate synthase/chorismate mutase type II, partial [Bacteroidales bacterium]|nr:bifunctional 3-deoxy-7-phosphoheptulonate synthase/chorismate mutase type II [Bacteroidales bacterium]